MNNMDALLLIVVILVALFFIGSFARILREYERAVIFRLGRSTRAILNPGISLRRANSGPRWVSRIEPTWIFFRFALSSARERCLSDSFEKWVHSHRKRLAPRTCSASPGNHRVSPL